MQKTVFPHIDELSEAARRGEGKTEEGSKVNLVVDPVTTVAGTES
jgi:hypothetical protein